MATQRWWKWPVKAEAAHSGLHFYKTHILLVYRVNAEIYCPNLENAGSIGCSPCIQ